MRIPEEPAARVAWLRETSDRLRETLDQRRSNYAAWNAWFLYGATEWGARYNKIKPSLSGLSARLYAPRSARFTLPTGDADVADLARRLSFLDRLRTLWSVCGADAAVTSATLASLIDGCALQKYGWRDGRPTSRIVRAKDFCVWRGDLPALEGQQALMHLYRLDVESVATWLRSLGMPEPELERWLGRWGRGQRRGTPLQGSMMIGALNPITWDGSPPSGTAGAVTDWGSTSAEYRDDSASSLEVEEVWAWDDAAADWRIFQTLEKELVVSDRGNDFLPKRHPFVHECVDPVPDYFWGFSQCAALIPLQVWREKRMNQLDRMFARQARPPMVATGFMGVTDEKAAAIMRRGGLITSQTPGAKVDLLAPRPDELSFTEIAEIDAMFSETLGLTPTQQGRAEQGVKGGLHAEALMNQAAENMAARSVMVEHAVTAGAQLLFDLARRYDPTMLADDDSKPFLAAMLDEDATVEVANHSTSPAYAGTLQALAFQLLEAGIADKEGVIDLADPPMAAALKARLRASEAKQAAELKAAEAAIPAADKAGFFAQLFGGTRKHH